MTIVIISSDNATPIIYKPPNTLATIFLGYEVGVHYQSLIKNNNQQPEYNIEHLIANAEYDNCTILNQSTDHYPKNVPINMQYNIIEPANTNLTWLQKNNKGGSIELESVVEQEYFNNFELEDDFDENDMREHSRLRL